MVFGIMQPQTVLAKSINRWQKNCNCSNDSFSNIFMINNSSQNPTDLVCFSHLRWDFVFQRPQHLMTRFARERRVFFVEEPMRGGAEPRLEVRDGTGGVRVVVPHLPESMELTESALAQRRLLDELIEDEDLQRYACWYYTPMALPFSRHLTPVVVAYDCMDELSLFRGAPPALVDLEKELLSRADVVFTGGISLYEAKRNR